MVIHERIALRDDGLKPFQCSRAAGFASSAAASSRRLLEPLRGVEGAPGAVRLRRLDRRDPGSLELPLALEPRDPLLVRRRPVAPRLARREELQAAPLVQPVHRAVDPAEAERLLDGLVVARALSVRPLLVEDEPDRVALLVPLREPAAPRGAVSGPRRSLARPCAVPSCPAYEPGSTKARRVAGLRGREGDGRFAEKLVFPVVSVRRRHGLDDLTVDVRVRLLRVEPDDVVAGTAVDLVDHAVAGERVHPVVAGTAVLDVGATADPDPVVAVVTVHGVVAPAAAEDVVALAAVHGVIARPAAHAVVPTLTVQGVVATTAVHTVVAVASVDEVVAATGVDAVVSGRARQRFAVMRPLDNDDAVGDGGAHEAQRHEGGECERAESNRPSHS